MERGYAALEIAAYYELKVSIDENAVTLKGDLIEGKIQYRATKGNAEAVVFEGMRGVPANSQEFKRFSITPAGQKEAVLQFLDPRHKAPPLFLTKG
jgi:hypothetical protein